MRRRVDVLLTPSVKVVRDDLAPKKTSEKARAGHGDEVTFTIEVFNQSPDPEGVARNIVVTDYPLSGFSLVAAKSRAGRSRVPR